MSDGHCVEKSDIGSDLLLKQVWQESLSKKNTIDITEHRIENDHLRPDHESKVHYVKRFDIGANPGRVEMKVKG